MSLKEYDISKSWDNIWNSESSSRSTKHHLQIDHISYLHDWHIDMKCDQSEDGKCMPTAVGVYILSIS